MFFVSDLSPKEELEPLCKVVLDQQYKSKQETMIKEASIDAQCCSRNNKDNSISISKKMKPR